MCRGVGASTVSSNSLPTSSRIVTPAYLSPVNLPVGAVAIPFIIFFLRSSSDRTDLSPNWKSILLQFDPIGTVLFVAGIICLLIGLQWGGSEYSWSNAREITLMTLFGVLMIAWGITQHKMSENATVPLRIARQRTVAFSTFYIFFGSACFVLVIYYLPIWYATHARPQTFGD